MYRKLSLIFVILIFAAYIAGVSVHADTQGNVIDYLNYLTENEVTKLKTNINYVKDNYGLDVVIVITDDTQGKSSMDFADDFYDYNGYGIGSDKSGLLALINMQDREVWISTRGHAIDIFTDKRISNMVDHVTGKLSDGEYFDACRIFIDDIESYANVGVPKGQHRINTDPSIKKTYFSKALGLMKAYPVYIAAFIISVLSTLGICSLNKGRVTINSRTYEEHGSFILSDMRDNYVRESTTRTKIETSSSDSGSSTHSGSSGTTHGGGGGRF